jgi:hypothetical protein
LEGNFLRCFSEKDWSFSECFIFQNLVALGHLSIFFLLKTKERCFQAHSCFPFFSKKQEKNNPNSVQK